MSEKSALQFDNIISLFAERDPTKKMELLGYAKKLAHRHAYENAFKRVIIISLDNGKVGVEINMQDIPECSLDESGEEGIVQINYLEEMLFSDSEDEKKLRKAKSAVERKRKEIKSISGNALKKI